MTKLARLILPAAALLALAAAPAAQARVEATFAGGILTVTGDEVDDTITVLCDAAGNVEVNGGNPKGGPLGCAKVVEIDAAPGAGNDVVDYSGVTDAFGEARFGGFGVATGAAAVTGPGNDRFVPSSEAFNLFYGEDGKDSGEGGPRRDLLSGGNGSDTLRGRDGRDTLLGNGDGDKLFGEDGADTISGHGGNDLLNGAAGSDAIGGGSGRDRLLGGPGGDKLAGGPGKDRMRGGAGKDREEQDPPKRDKP